MSKAVPEGTKDSKRASLDYEVLKYEEEINLSVLKIHLNTGRHHQIRVQLKDINHPIVGDKKYGNSSSRMFLHAYKLEFTLNNKEYKFETEYPNIFKKLIK